MKVLKTAYLLAIVPSYLAFGSSIADAKPAKSKPRIIPAFDSSQSHEHPTKDLNYDYAVLSRPSPDGKYIAHLRVGDGEIPFLTVYRRPAKGKLFLKQDRVSEEFECVGGCAWVPEHAHWLLVSRDGNPDYTTQKSAILLWTAGKHLRFLRLSQKEDGPSYNVRGIASDGSFITVDEANGGEKTKKYTMKLPHS